MEKIFRNFIDSENVSIIGNNVNLEIVKLGNYLNTRCDNPKERVQTLIEAVSNISILLIERKGVILGIINSVETISNTEKQNKMSVKAKEFCGLTDAVIDGYFAIKQQKTQKIVTNAFESWRKCREEENTKVGLLQQNLRQQTVVYGIMTEIRNILESVILTRDFVQTNHSLIVKLNKEFSELFKTLEVGIDYNCIPEITDQNLFPNE